MGRVLPVGENFKNNAFILTFWIKAISTGQIGDFRLLPGW
jgi:hypothetical protein